MSQKLIDYIESELQKGTALEIITSALAAKGWSVQDIQEAITKVQQNTESTSIQTNNTRIDTQNENQNTSFLDIIYSRLVAIFFFVAPFISFVISAMTESQELNFDPVSNLSGLITMILCIGIGIGLLFKKSAFWYIAIVSLVFYLLILSTTLIPSIISTLVITQSFMEVIPSLIQIIIYSLVIVLLIKIKHVYIVSTPNCTVSSSIREKFKSALWGLAVGTLPCILLTAMILETLGESRKGADGMAGIAAAAVISTALFIFLILGLIILFFIVKRKKFKPAQILISFFTFLSVLFAPLIIAYLIVLTINTLTNPVYRAALVRETQTNYLKKKLSFEVLGEQLDSKSRTIDISLKVNNTSEKELNVAISDVRLDIPRKVGVSYPLELSRYSWIAESVNFPDIINEEKILIPPRGEGTLDFKLQIVYKPDGTNIHAPEDKQDVRDAAQIANILTSFQSISVCGMLEIEGVAASTNDYDHCSGTHYFGQTKPHDWLNLSY